MKKNRTIRERSGTTVRKEQLLKQICTYVDEHLAERINLATVSEHFQVSISTVTQLFQYKSDMTFHQYLTHRRMAAAEALISRGIPLEEVGKQVGYNDHSSFYRAFRQHFGTSPREFKRRGTK